MAEERQYDNMVGKPLFDILSKLPSKSLLRFRCVSKLWREYIDDSYFVSVHDKQVIEDPTPIMFYKSGFTTPLCFHTFESDAMTNHVLKAKNKVPVIDFVGKPSRTFDFVGKKLLSRTPRYKFVGSCNGLVLIESTYDRKSIPTFMVINPINKQCYVLPQLPLCYNSHRESCGLGFDPSTNTFKMVCVLYHDPNCCYCEERRAQCTMVHVFGTNSWQKIPQVQSYCISGKAIFAHGCLHWLVTYFSNHVARQVIWFDVKNEEFGLIKPPVSNTSKRYYNPTSNDHLVNLDGQVGYFCNGTTKVWVLNHKKEWVLHCNLEDHGFPYGEIEVLGCLNKDGDILIKLTNWDTRKEMFYKYNLINRVMHQARIDGLDLEYGSEMDMVLFPNSLCDIMTNSKFDQKKSLKKT